jgi:hypothetical protein
MQGEEILSNQQSGMGVYMKLVMIMGIRLVNCHVKKNLTRYNVLALQHS